MKNILRQTVQPYTAVISHVIGINTTDSLAAGSVPVREANVGVRKYFSVFEEDIVLGRFGFGQWE